ncbi:latent-transforming growth factor beta-binding protein 2 [Cricetulus griseus]|nr:latent-transforming growth factor beta-binding protein 2 [Cricetulus griseus]
MLVPLVPLRKVFCFLDLVLTGSADGDLGLENLVVLVAFTRLLRTAFGQVSCQDQKLKSNGGVRARVSFWCCGESSLHNSCPKLRAILILETSVCQPPCQNRGSCSRPQLCVCRSGFRGARCEEVIPEEEFDPQNAKPGPRRSVEGVPSPHRNSEARGSLVTRIQPLAPPPLPASNKECWDGLAFYLSSGRAANGKEKGGSIPEQCGQQGQLRN